MKKIIIFLLHAFFICISPATAKEKSYGRVEISFDYNRAERDFANNQFSAWLEDMDGNLVSTLFVTRFTAKGGWEIRKETLPTWKKKSNIERLTDEEVDAISGATPKAQTLVFQWPEKNNTHSFLPTGVYKYFVECNYFWEDTVLYGGVIRVGDIPDKNDAVPRYSSKSAENYKIIENVTARYLPHR